MVEDKNQIYIILHRTFDEDDGSEEIGISTFPTFNSLRSSDKMYNKNVESLVFVANNQIFSKLDNLENIEYDTAAILLTALFEDSIMFDKILSDEFTNLEEQITALKAEVKLLKEQLADCQGNQ